MKLIDVVMAAKKKAPNFVPEKQKVFYAFG